MIFDTPGMEFEIVSSAKAKLLRETFIKKFVDITSSHYQKYIETMRQDGDDSFYAGYLWDCLQCNEDYQKECSMETAAGFLMEKKNVFMMWDLFSKERFAHKRFSLEYPKDTVVSMRGCFLSQKVVEEWNVNRPHTLQVIIVKVYGFHRIYIALMKVWNGMLSSPMKVGKKTGKNRMVQN